MKITTKTVKWSVFILLIFQTVSAQIKIGNNPTIINASAILEIESTNTGFLLPRLPLTNVSLSAPLAQHVAGMIVYNTATAKGLSPGFYYNDGTKWIGVSSSTVTGLLSAENGLTNLNGIVKLGGVLNQPTVLTTTAINTFAIKGLGAGDTVQGDFVVIDKITGVLKTIPYSVIENIIDKKVDSNPKIIPGIKTKITYDEKGLVVKGEDVSLADIKGLQAELDKKAPLVSPLFTGTPKTIPINITSSDNSIVNKSYVDDEIRQAKIALVSQTIIDGKTITAPSENAVYDALALKAPKDSPTFTGIARAVTPTTTSDGKTIATKEYVDVIVTEAKTGLISQSILLNNTTTAPSEDAVRKELDLKAPVNSPVFTGVAKVPDIKGNTITDPLAIANKGYVDDQITSAGNIYNKDGTLTDNRKVTLDGKSLDFIGTTATNPTRLNPDGSVIIGGNINLNNKVTGTNAPVNALQFTNDENGAGYAAASITAQTGDDKGKGQLSFKVKTATGVDTEAVRITDKGNVLAGDAIDNNSAVLNVQSTTKGVLMPRQTKEQRDLITTPPTGLQVYQTDVSGSSREGQYLKTSTGWNRMLLEGDVKLDYYDAINDSGAAISGASTPVAVYIKGVDGSNNTTIAIADAGNAATARFEGVIVDNVPAGAPCKVYLRYISYNVDTSSYAQNGSVFLGTGGSFTADPSSLPFGVRIGKAFSVDPANPAILFTAYLVADVLRNQYEQINGGIDETIFTGPVASGSAPIADNYLTNKKYVDETVASLQQYQGVWNAATNTPTLVGAATAKKGWTYDVTVASGSPVKYTNMCTSTNILKGDIIKFDGTCWVVIEKQYPSATTIQEGMVKLDGVISSSTTLVPTSNLLKSVSDANIAHINNKSNPHGVTKAQVGLGNADDTSDVNKPVSTLQQTALNLKADKLNGASQITDNNAYGNIGTLAGAAQASINAGINAKLSSQTQLNGTGLVRMAGTTVSYDNIVYAPLNSPVFTGDAQAVEAAINDNDNSIATTSFVHKTASGGWSKLGNDINDTDFIGTINNKDLVFKAYNTERMRINQSLPQVEIGTSASPTSLRINTTTELSKNIPVKITTSEANPFITTFGVFGSGTETHYLDINSYVYDSTNFLNIPGNISMQPDGGIISIGKKDFTGLSEKLEVNGNVRATGFKIPNGTSSQFLMADGSTSTGSFSSEWSLNGNEITAANFIGSTNNFDIIFKTNNRERWRMGSNSGRFYIGDIADPNSGGSLYIVPEGGTTDSTPITIKTADLENPLTMEFQTKLSGSSKYFNIRTFVGDNTTFTPTNLSLMSEGGILNLGYADFTDLTEKLEVNGNVRASGFKVPNGTNSQYLMADGSVSSLSASGWALNGNAGTTPGTHFIGTTDNKDLVFKANNIERMRVSNTTGKLTVGNTVAPGSLTIVTSSTSTTAPLSLVTSDANPLVMTFQDIGFAPNNMFAVDAFHVGSPNTPANLSYLAGGGLFSIGFNDYEGLTEKLEVNGNVRAAGFKIPNGTGDQFLMADGSVSTGSSTGLFVDGGVDNTLKPIKDASNNTNTGVYVSSKSITAYGSANANNTAFGMNALAQAGIGRFNTAFGFNALYNITSGENNTALGFGAGSGSNNGSNSVYVGANTVASTSTASNEIVIGAGIAGNGSNTTTIGDSNTIMTYLRGTVSSNGAFANTSDERLKTNVTKVENGLADVMQLNPVTYDKKRTLESNNYDLHEIGFIAQDLQKIFPKGVVFEGTDKDKLLAVNYDAIIPVLTKAIQEQQKIIEEEKSKNDTQQKEIDELKTMVKQLMEKK
ncbi:tail fiber domain-containing protein [Flavobacterium aquidurense]|uniref:tail fiber domain-containing protein n=1 Tax=Flavobacterium aquidurense TaxID=362413 RepID=UPI002856C049|nr:tail fiber domain-containing protein [Flavobacterium aquidurense]MDR7370344.1 hypothetical protein [Flavobacterium aquidurense]